jgi:PPK2 family polyphosphate:nucleotide phosphotransferase
MDASKYVLVPGSPLRLQERDPADRSACAATKEENQTRLAQLAGRISELQDVLYAERAHAVLVILQGTDTSGKDGTIRHVFGEIDPLGVRAVSFKAPSEDERAHDFLWRVHHQVPGKGELVIFNRSHYEDVLIVRVHKLIDLAECKLRYQHINDFERLLRENGVLVLKFFLHISKQEQRKRLRKRLEDPNKQWKFNPADLDERKLWNDYARAYADALAATSTEEAPWYVIPADSKTNRNLAIASIVCEKLEALDMRYPRSKIKAGKVVIK